MGRCAEKGEQDQPAHVRQAEYPRASCSMRRACAGAEGRSAEPHLRRRPAISLPSSRWSPAATAHSYFLTEKLRMARQVGEDSRDDEGRHDVTSRTGAEGRARRWSDRGTAKLLVDADAIRKGSRATIRVSACRRQAAPVRSRRPAALRGIGFSARGGARR